MGSRHVLVLTAEAGVEDALGRAARAALQAAGFDATPPRRLAPGALEIGFMGPLPEGFAPGPLAQGAPVDANLVPAEGRAKRVLVADMDSTIIGVECIDELADFAGVKPQVAAVTEAAMRGDLDFEAALAERVALLEGLDASVLERAYVERVRLNPGARVLAATMAGLGAATALVSGGFTFFSERVAAAAGFAEHRANRLEIAGGRVTGRVLPPVLGRAAKRATLAELCARLGLSEAAAVAIGDGANDLEMVAAAGLGVAYRGKPALAAAASARLDHSDLTAVLALQGIPVEKWRD